MVSFIFYLLNYCCNIKMFKKTAPNGKITLYLGNRDYNIHQDHSDIIDGVVTVDAAYLKGKKVFGQVVATFRYGKEEDEIMGLRFSRQFYVLSEQVYPFLKSFEKISLNNLQTKLMNQSDSNVFPFRFELPPNGPASVTLQPGPKEEGLPIGVEYKIQMFASQSDRETIAKKNIVSLAFRRLNYSLPTSSKSKPSCLVSRGFIMSSGKLNLEVNLDQDVYYHDDRILVTLKISNQSKKSVKSIKISVVQEIKIGLINGHYTKTVNTLSVSEGCPIAPRTSFRHSYQLQPLNIFKKNKKGVALNGVIKDEEPQLASTTLTIPQGFSIIVSYTVQVRLNIGFIDRDIIASLPFKLLTLDPNYDKDKEESSTSNSPHTSNWQ